MILLAAESISIWILYLKFHFKISATFPPQLNIEFVFKRSYFAEFLLQYKKCLDTITTSTTLATKHSNDILFEQKHFYSNNIVIVI